MSFDDKFPDIDKNIIKASEFQWSKVTVIKDTCTFVFTIENLSILNKKNQEFIKSPEFTMNKNKNIKWFLSIYPDGNNKENINCLSLFLNKHFDSPLNLKVVCKFSLIGKDNVVLKELSFTVTFDKEVSEYGYYKFLSKEELAKKNDYLPNDSFTVICKIETELEISTKTKKIEESVQVIKENMHSNSSTTNADINFENYEKMFENEVYSDVTFIVEGKEIKAHKCLLIESSPVLASILRKDDKNASTDSIVVSDVSYEIMKEMLRFIYTKKIFHLDDIAHELISAADKYSIKDLKHICEKVLCKNINLSNVLKMIVIADINAAKELKNLALEIVINNKKELGSTPEYKEMLEARPNLMEDLFWLMTLKDE